MSQSQGHVVAVSSPPEPPRKPEAGEVLPPRPPGWEGNESNTLLVVATLITALTYQVGTNIPGGYWQDDNGHVAGDPIMRDKQRRRYWLFMAASWVGFGSSMLMTLSLLTGAPVKSRRVRYPFVVAYSTLVLAFITSQPRTSLIMDLALWGSLLLFLWAAISFKNWGERGCWRAPLDRLKNASKRWWS